MAEAAVALATPINLPDIKRYLQDPDWYATQKIDGQRYVVVVDNGTVAAHNRKGSAVTVPGFVMDDFADGTFSKGQWRFDGELTKDAYNVFDVLTADSKDLTSMTYESRIELLERIFSLWKPENCTYVQVARTEDEKVKMARVLLAHHAEGMVFRHRESSYLLGKSKQMRKAKFYKTCDVVVTELNRGGKEQAVTVSLFDKHHLFEVCGCKIPVDLDIAVNDVMEVRYLYATLARKLVQPVFLRLRDDKAPESCDFSQMEYIGDNAVIDWKVW